MENRFTYHGMDLTLDLYEKINRVVEILSERDGIEFDESYAQFSASQVFEGLNNPQTLMWSESAEFIVDEYDREMIKAPM